MKLNEPVYYKWIKRPDGSGDNLATILKGTHVRDWNYNLLKLDFFWCVESRIIEGNGSCARIPNENSTVWSYQSKKIN